MLLIAILAGTLLAGVGSVWLAAALSFGALARFSQHLLSLAAGALLATAFMHLLPEAFESGVEAHTLFAVLLAGLVGFFLLDKAELWHHGHEHHHGDAGAAAAHAHDHAHADDHGHAHPHAAAHAAPRQASHAHAHAHPAHNPGSWAVIAGDSVHCFGDGLLIASAFIADMKLGVVAALAVLAHEVPHHMGDLAVLRTGGNDRRMALLKVTLAGSVTALGGLLGFLLVGALAEFLPFFLVVASSSFIYVALADLIPQLQKRLGAAETRMQLLWLAVGIGAVTLLSSFTHPH
ncbi:ZIP family metal transporter [Tibeticola sp.]|uniref:ZIP family metal transporter n=1 Tax=Tibeticola sp. TaxID=2005368 RepID=UPI0025E0EE40|nr:ZIP family metal transporter [Tibeticola sp.]